jgi:hypothetical protein
MKRFFFFSLALISLSSWATPSPETQSKDSATTSPASLQISEHVVHGVNVGGLYNNDEDASVAPGPIRPLSNLDHDWVERQRQILKESVLW